MIKLKTRMGKVNIRVRGDLTELTADAFIILKAICDTIKEKMSEEDAEFFQYAVSTFAGNGFRTESEER